MKQLDFTLSLIDKLSRPLKQAQGNVTGFAEKSKEAFMQIGGGVLGLAGTGMAIKGALMPAIEMYDALNDAAAKGIDDSALKAVQRDALRFSTTYGASAVEFVQSTESINASIAGLTGNELPKVTKVANTLAFALKSTAAETAEFMGQMFGNFSADANRLGKVEFAEQLAGKMVYMRKTFGTEMAAIKDLMEGARGVGTNYGVGLDEQLAVLGQLQRTLGTEASSAYEGFMTGAIEGGKKLGLSFTDSTGKMLSMPEMLIKLQGKYGKSLEGNLKAQAELDAAFGDSSAVVKHLYGNVALLQRNITELGGADGLKRTQEMAQKNGEAVGSLCRNPEGYPDRNRPDVDPCALSGPEPPGRYGADLCPLDAAVSQHCACCRVCGNGLAQLCGCGRSRQYCDGCLQIHHDGVARDLGIADGRHEGLHRGCLAGEHCCDCLECHAEISARYVAGGSYGGNDGRDCYQSDELADPACDWCRCLTCCRLLAAD